MSRTILAKRTDRGTADTDELAALLAAEGHEVLAEHTATRPEAAATNLGQDLLDRVTAAAREHDAELVAVDNELTPPQTLAVAERLPDGVRIRDRSRIILDLFAQRAGTRAAQLQVKIAELEYERELQRELLTEGDVGGFWPDGEHRSVQAIERRLTKARAELADQPDPRERHRERRAQGFDLVAVVGYTNAGKSTLLRRLADDLSLDEGHADQTGIVSVEDRPFETLGTTTRRATLGGRRALVTDTVGFVSDLPHELVRSFDATFAAAREADAVLFVVDAADPRDRMERKVAVAREQLADAEGTVVPILNKADRASPERIAAARELFESEPVVTSATEGNLDGLRERVVAELPTDEATLSVPNSDAAMRLVSWCYDHADVEDVRYGEGVEIRLRGKPSVVAEAQRRAEEVRA